MDEHRIIIDTDPGVDDAMAIFYALSAARIRVEALTTVYGNVDADLATTNALRLLEVAGRPEIPVARGAVRPLTSPYKGAVDFVHGTDGQGEAGLDPPKTARLAERATELIISRLRSNPGRLTLVALGPLTNLALALLEAPDIAGLARQVVIMGGNLTVPGNASVAAEANILNDPEAAEIVLTAGWPVVMVGLDVTQRIVMTPEDLERIYRIPRPEARHLARIVPYYHRFYAEEVGCNGIYVHDSSTISYLLHPEAFSLEERGVVVDTGAGIGRGRTWPIPVGDEAAGDPRLRGRPPIRYALEADARRLIEAEIAALERQPDGT